MTNFSLSFTYFGGAPCSGGTSRISITRKTNDLLVIDQLVGEGPDYERRATVPASHGWRGIVSYLAREEIVAYGTDGDMSGEYPFPHLMTPKGRDSLAADMVALAWAGEPLREFAKAFSQHSDTNIETLRSRYTSLRSEAFIDDLLRFKRWADHLCIDADDTLARSPRFGFDLREMRRDLIHTARVLNAEEKAAKLRHQWKLSPYQPQIDAVVTAWRRANPPTSTNTQMGHGIRAGALIRALEAYVIEHGKLPDGEVLAKTDRSIAPFTVDVGKLREAEA